MKFTHADALGTALAQWEAEHPIVGDYGDQPHDIWEDFIFQVEGFDPEETERADPKMEGDRFVVRLSGHLVLFRWDREERRWMW